MNPNISPRNSGSAELLRPANHPAPSRAGAQADVAGDTWRARVTKLLDDSGYDAEEVLPMCEQWLDRVSGPELDLRCGGDSPFAEFVLSLEAGLFELLADEAQQRSGVPIRSVLLEGSICAEGLPLDSLAGLQHLESISIEGPFHHTPMKLILKDDERKPGLPVPLEYIALSGSLDAPFTIELPPDAKVKVDTSRLYGPGVLASTVVQRRGDEGDDDAPEPGDAVFTTHMTGMIDGPVPADIHERIVTEVLKGPHADLTTLTDHEVWALQSASPHRWASWIETARARGGAPVETMSIGGNFVVGSALAQGLRQFSSLKELTLGASMAGRPGRVGSVNVNVLDLGALQGANAFGDVMQLQSVHLSGDIPKPVLVLLPPGVSQHTRGGTNGLSLQKSWIGRVGADGRVMEEIGYHSLDGEVHLSRARLFEEPAGQRSQDSQVTAWLHNVNMQFDLDFETSRGTEPMQVNCGLLSALFLKLDTEAQESGQPMPWTAFLGENELAQAAPAELYGELMRMYQSGSCAIFEPDQFGVELRKAFAGMAPGEFRRFGLGTPEHLMGLVLHVKQRHDGLALNIQYVAKLYDPNNSASTLNGQVRSLADFDRLTLAHWLDRNEGVDGSRPDYARTLFTEDGEHHFATLFPWPPSPNGVARRASVSLTVSPEARASGEFLYAAMEDGHSELMEQCIADLVRMAASQPPGFLQKALRAKRSEREPGGLQVAVFNVPYECSRPDVAARYCRAVLDVPDDLLDVQSKIALLKGARHPLLIYALNNGGIDPVRLIAAEILASQTLGPADKLELLVPYAQLTALFGSITDNSPYLADRLNAGGRFAEYLAFVLGAPALPLEIKTKLLGAENWARGSEPFVHHRTYPAAAALVLAAIADCQASSADKEAMRAHLAFTEEQALIQLKGVIDAGVDDHEHRAALNVLLARMEAN